MSIEFITDDPESLFFECPRFVWVGALRYEIQVMPSDAQQLAGLLGCALPDEGRVLLADLMNPQVLANTAIHELIHCINRDRLVMQGSSEEHITDQIASGLCDLRVRNPDFFKWWERLLSA